MSSSPGVRLAVPLSQIPAASANGTSASPAPPSPAPLVVSSSSGGPLPPRLRSALNGALLSSNSIPTIQAALLHECQASGFVSSLRNRVRELLRSGECASYGEVMARVMGEIRGEDVGAAQVNGTRESQERLKVPTRVVEEGVRVVRQALEGVVEIGDD